MHIPISTLGNSHFRSPMIHKLTATTVLVVMATSMSDAYNHKGASSSPSKVSKITLCAPVNISGFDPSDAADIFWSGYLAGATNLFSSQGFISNYDYGARTTVSVDHFWFTRTHSHNFPPFWLLSSLHRLASCFRALAPITPSRSPT
jgi:hypothetical protein